MLIIKPFFYRKHSFYLIIQTLIENMLENFNLIFLKSGLSKFCLI